MKTRRFIAGLSALALAAAMAPMAAFSDTPDKSGDPFTATANSGVSIGETVSGTTNSNTDVINITEKTDKTEGKQLGSTTATYTVDPTYTVTIPSAAPIGDDANSANPQEIKAENVVLEEGQKITVTLSGASNTTGTGTVFNAMTGKSGDTNRSTVKYNIKKTIDETGADTVITNIALNGKVAEFTGNQSVQLKFIKDSTSTPTAAGAHTEQLTFSIAVEEPAAPSLADAFKNGSVTAVKVNNKNGGTNIYGFTYNDGTFTSISPDSNNGYTSNSLSNVKLTKENNDLVLKTMAIEDGSFSMTPQFVRTYTFNTSNNTYTYTPPTDVNNSIENCRTFISISVNGTEIPVTLES